MPHRVTRTADHLIVGLAILSLVILAYGAKAEAATPTMFMQYQACNSFFPRFFAEVEKVKDGEELDFDPALVRILSRNNLESLTFCLRVAEIILDNIPAVDAAIERVIKYEDQRYSVTYLPPYKQ
jgi:hypothetical protein